MNKTGLKYTVLLLFVFFGIFYELAYRPLHVALTPRKDIKNTAIASSSQSNPVNLVQPATPYVQSQEHEFKSFPSGAVTDRDTTIFVGNDHTKKLISLPKGQMVYALELKDRWIKVQLYNGGGEGYTKSENLIRCSGDGSLGSFPLPEKSHSVIDPETDTAGLLFTLEEPTAEKNIEIKDINLQEEAARFGVKGPVGNVSGKIADFNV